MAPWPISAFAEDRRAAPKARSRRARSRPERWLTILWRSFHETASPNREAIPLRGLTLATLLRPAGWGRWSWLIRMLFILEIHSTVFVQTPQMDGDKENDCEGQNNDVQHVKA